MKLGGYGAIFENGSKIENLWGGLGTGHSTPFARLFYLILSLAVGGTSGWFVDGVDDKPWVDVSVIPRMDFWDARD